MPCCKVHWCHWKTPSGLSSFLEPLGWLKYREHRLACVLINLETVCLVSTHTYPKWTSTHLHQPFSLERQFWSLKSWSCETIITNAILSICRNSCFRNHIERQTLSNLFCLNCVLSKEMGWGISRASGDKNSYSKYSLGCFFSSGETYLDINKEEHLEGNSKVKICKIRLQPTRYSMTIIIRENLSSCREILPTWCCRDKKYMLIN